MSHPTVQAFACAALGLGVALASGCEPTTASGPPELRLGRDECVECGMIISEDRCSSGLQIERLGSREHVVFDDIGCMLDYQSQLGSDLRVIGVFVHDHSSRNWTPADSASFLVAPSDAIHTPMGSGIIAFADNASAVAAQRTFGGEVFTLTRVQDARRTLRDARRAPAQEPQ